LLVIGGLAFLINSDALSAVLALSLLVLLVWVAAVTIVCARVPPAHARRRQRTRDGAVSGSSGRR
jgi:hypothetical protein